MIAAGGLHTVTRRSWLWRGASSFIISAPLSRGGPVEIRWRRGRGA